MEGAGSELPTGTVTFLMTDIERSTELVRRLGDRWPALAGEHRRLVREAVSEAAGHEVDARGEELFFVFRRAADAVVAAAGAQRALTEHEWPPDAEVRVRMGIHTGEPALGDDGATSASTSIAPRASALPVTAARCWSRRPLGRSLLMGRCGSSISAYSV